MKSGENKLFQVSFYILYVFLCGAFAPFVYAETERIISPSSAFATSSADVQEGYWMSTLVCIIVLAIIGVFSARRLSTSEDSKTKVQQEADTYEIIEGDSL